MDKMALLRAECGGFKSVLNETARYSFTPRNKLMEKFVLALFRVDYF
jgi:hypothetical protein